MVPYMASVHGDHKRTGGADKWKQSYRVEAVTPKHNMPNFSSSISGLRASSFQIGGSQRNAPTLFPQLGVVWSMSFDMSLKQTPLDASCDQIFRGIIKCSANRMYTYNKFMTF